MTAKKIICPNCGKKLQTVSIWRTITKHPTYQTKYPPTGKTECVFNHWSYETTHKYYLDIIAGIVIIFFQKAKSKVKNNLAVLRRK